MMPTDRFERQIPDLLAELAEPRTPDYLDDLLGQTARTRQRPAWSFLERWLPMFEITRQSVVAPRVPWRTLGLLALLIVALAAGIILVVGSLPRVPPPFGLAGNGQIAFDSNGDIFLRDSGTSAVRPILGGPDTDVAPVFSQQGTRLAFIREGAGGRATIVVAAADGSDPVAITGPLYNISSFVWSPDGATLAIAYEEHGAPVVMLAESDGSGYRMLDIGSAENPLWRAPAGNQLLVRIPAWRSGPGLYLVRPDGTGLTRLELETENLYGGIYDFRNPTWSPDGTRLAFEEIHSGVAPAPDGHTEGYRIHVAELSPDGTVERDTRLEYSARSHDEGWSRWSPDGDRLLFQAVEGGVSRLVVGDVDGSGVVQSVGPETDDTGFAFEWAPDGKAIVAFDNATLRTWLIDPLSGSSVVGENGVAAPSWQRVAP